ncbi:MAG: hypothetical protein U0223_11705 [Nitrospira sp.]|nr:hypothetical protein [Nitrospira sp.]
MFICFKIEIGSFVFDWGVGGPGVLIRWGGKDKVCWIGRDETGWVVVRG